MATIKEMAKKYCEGSSFSDSCMEQPAYIAGANAIIKELEPLVTTLRTDVKKLFEDKIKELKGE